MATIHDNVVVGVFQEVTSAHEAVEHLMQLGFLHEQIGFIAPHSQIQVSPDGTITARRPKDDLIEGVETGALTGAGLFGVLAAAMATASMPVIGPVIAGGALASIAAATAAGAVAGGVVGGLVGLGMPQEHASYYERALQEGRTVVTVKTADRQEEAAQILNIHDAENIEPADAASNQPPPKHLDFQRDQVAGNSPSAGGFTPSGGLLNELEMPPFHIPHSEPKP